MYRVYEQNVGALTPVIADRLTEAMDTYGSEWVVRAIEVATSREKRNLSYVEGVLRNWKQNGFDNGRSPKESLPKTNEDVIRSVANAAAGHDKR